MASGLPLQRTERVWGESEDGVVAPQLMSASVDRTLFGRVHPLGVPLDESGMDMKADIPTAEILVVDCDDRMLASNVSMLRSEGYGATGAATFETARRLIKVNRYDLLMTALRLLPYNGLHLVIHNQALHPETKAIVLAGPSDVGSDVEAERLGAHCVRTPVGPDRLLASIRMVLEGRMVRTVMRWKAQSAY